MLRVKTHDLDAIPPLSRIEIFQLVEWRVLSLQKSCPRQPYMLRVKTYDLDALPPLDALPLTFFSVAQVKKLSPFEIKWVVTVPAIWQDVAKVTLRSSCIYLVSCKHQPTEGG